MKITQRIIHIFEKLSVDYPKRVIVLFAIASMILILGMFRIEINTVFSEFLFQNVARTCRNPTL